MYSPSALSLLRGLAHARLAVLLASAAVLFFAPLPARAQATTPAVHTHISPDGQTIAPCSCREATPEERLDLSLSPDGQVQAEPRESYSRGTVPFPLVPDWTGGRTRAIGCLAWGDADNDGDEDLFVGTYWANQYPPVPDYYNFMYLNQGGTFSDPPQWISSDQKHTSEAVWGFINNDSYPDIFLANGGSSLQACQVFYGQAGLLPTSAGWSSNTANWTTGCDARDFDKDGDLDVAISNQGNTANPYRPTQLFLNTGNGLNPTPVWSSNQVGITSSCSWGDMDNDGWDDLAVSGWSSWQSGVFRNLHTTLDPDFAWTSNHPERTDKGTGWSDVDGDNRLDLCIGGNGAPDWIFHNEGSTLGATPIWASAEAYHGTQQLLWKDIDADGDEDLTTVQFSTGHVRIYLNEGGVLPTIADWQYDDAVSATAIAYGDLNGDHMPDLATATANGPVKIFLNTSNPTGVPETAADLPRSALKVSAGPNPFRGRLVLTIESARPVTAARLDFYDLQGRRIAGLDRGIRSATGSGRSAARTSTWTWTPPAGTSLPAGVYLVRAEGRTADGTRLSATCRAVRLAK